MGKAVSKNLALLDISCFDGADIQGVDIRYVS